MSRIWESSPLVIAANRDERYSRAASPPQLHLKGESALVAPVDEEAGGTWIGLNRHGVVAAITNRHGDGQDPTRTSRGGLVFEALRGGSASRCLDRISRLSPAHYNGFHLMVADREGGGVIWSDGRTFTRLSLDPGLHVITEGSFRATPCVREEWLRTDPLGWLGGSTTPTDQDLESLLATEQGQGPVAVSVAAPGIGYGTRSSSIIRLGDPSLDPIWREASGPPGQVPYEAQDGLIAPMMDIEA